ncbi:AmmeMemoRadiSam system protein B [Candidatus Uhrbacteria bacterium]|nr:AmmeMemoRadiSam system protein B [Candidatus Uhrbacteria bacterium]
MLNFAAFTPHSPLLIDTIGKDNINQLAQTRFAIQKLSDELQKMKPDVILLISSHSFMHEEAFSINLHDEYIVEFKEFGDLSTSKNFLPDLELISAIQRETRKESIPFVLESHVSLDYGSGVPLFLLCNEWKPRLVPVSYSGTDRKQHMAFGRILKDIVYQSKKRIAVIASGDLSHSLSSEAPMGFAQEGKEFDEMIKLAIEQLSSYQLLSFDEKQVEKASECALRPLLILFGIIERMKVRPEIHSYEAPFGVGYLVAQFHIL